ALLAEPQLDARPGVGDDAELRRPPPVGGPHADAARREGPGDRLAGTLEPQDERLARTGHQRSFSVDNASSAQTIDTIQNRTMICGSGHALNQRKPSPAAASAPQNTASSPAPGTNGICRYSAILAWPAVYANTPRVPPAIMTGPIARPSSPSVRLTAFAAPTMTSAPNGMYQSPRSGRTSLKNGMVSCPPCSENP